MEMIARLDNLQSKWSRLRVYFTPKILIPSWVDGLLPGNEISPVREVIPDKILPAAEIIGQNSSSYKVRGSLWYCRPLLWRRKALVDASWEDLNPLASAMDLSLSKSVWNCRSTSFSTPNDAANLGSAKGRTMKYPRSRRCCRSSSETSCSSELGFCWTQ